MGADEGILACILCVRTIAEELDEIAQNLGAVAPYEIVEAGSPSVHVVTITPEAPGM